MPSTQFMAALMSSLLIPSAVTPFSRLSNGVSPRVPRNRSRLDPTIISSGTSTLLYLKFKTFDEMLHHHSDVPLLIDFYAPWCGPCKLMKDELTKIRPILDTMGPVRQAESEDDAEDCNVADAFQTSDCVGMHSESNNNIDNESAPSADAQPIASVKENEQVKAIKKPSGIPIYHVNANKFPQVGARNKIHGLPTLVLFIGGVEVWRVEGVMSGDEILKSIEENLGKVDAAVDSSIAIAEKVVEKERG